MGRRRRGDGQRVSGQQYLRAHIRAAGDGPADAHYIPMEEVWADKMVGTPGRDGVGHSDVVEARIRVLA